MADVSPTGTRTDAKNEQVTGGPETIALACSTFNLDKCLVREL